MLATSPPTALTVAPLLSPSWPRSWCRSRSLDRRGRAMARPVPGALARTFDYRRAAPFVRGARRGVDLAAAPGDAGPRRVRGRRRPRRPGRRAAAARSRCAAATCRVSYLPLAPPRRPAWAPASAPATASARVAAGHDGLHLGVRARRDPFGYEDPLPLLPPARGPTPLVAADTSLAAATRPHPPPRCRRCTPRRRERQRPGTTPPRPTLAGPASPSQPAPRAEPHRPRRGQRAHPGRPRLRAAAASAAVATRRRRGPSRCSAGLAGPSSRRLLPGREPEAVARLPDRGCLRWTRPSRRTTWRRARRRCRRGAGPVAESTSRAAYEYSARARPTSASLRRRECPSTSRRPSTTSTRRRTSGTRTRRSPRT